jgi:hypothetical protein
MYGFASVTAPISSAIDINSNVLPIGALLISLHMNVLRMRAYKDSLRLHNKLIYKKIKKKRIYKLR